MSAELKYDYFLQASTFIEVFDTES